jgi:hypothetical protein
MKKAWLMGLILMVSPGLIAGCSTFRKTVTLRIESEKHINGGVLLPMDVISAEGSLSDSILDVGPEIWFGHEIRERLVEEELRRFAVSGGQKRKVKLRVGGEVKRIIIYADYGKNMNRKGQQVVIEPKQWPFAGYKIQIRENELELLK